MIQRRIDRHKIENVTSPRCSVIVLMNTTYWERNFGVMLFKNSITGKILLKHFKHETNALYVQGIEKLKSKGFTITAIMYDDQKGLIQSFLETPIPICQFHQAVIIRRYLTKKLKLQAAKELINVVDFMKQADQEAFVGALNLWFEKWDPFLKERTVNPDTKIFLYP